MKVVALLTDFGVKDHYVGVVKGRILSFLKGKFSPYFIDITHEIPPQDIRRGALKLLFSYPYFPSGTIFLCVVDPGVGTKRRAIILTTERHIFVGPDNGLFTPIFQRESLTSCWEIEVEKILAPPYSTTFHARDLFAPVVAKLLIGEEPANFAQRVDPSQLVKIPFPKPTTTEKGIRVPVLDIDHFGNLITALSKEDCKQPFKVFIKGKEIPLLSTYGEGKRGELVALFGSEGYLEIAVVEGSAYQTLGLPEITIEFEKY